jgi:type VI protein secretion system component VasF
MSEPDPRHELPPDLRPERKPAAEPDVRNRKRVYFWLMGICVALIVLAWNVVRFWSIPAAVAMSAVAALIPPTAAILGNRGHGA